MLGSIRSSMPGTLSGPIAHCQIVRPTELGWGGQASGARAAGARFMHQKQRRLPCTQGEARLRAWAVAKAAARCWCRTSSTTGYGRWSRLGPGGRAPACLTGDEVHVVRPACARIGQLLVTRWQHFRDDWPAAATALEPRLEGRRAARFVVETGCFVVCALCCLVL